MVVEDNDVIDLTSSPERSPLVTCKIAKVVDNHYKKFSLPKSPKRSPESPGSPEGGWIDLGPVHQRQPAGSQPNPSALPPTQPIFENEALDPLDFEWRPSQANATAPPPKTKTQAAANGRKPKRTREEIAAEAAEKKAAKARETALRKEQREYNSDKHVLKYVTAVVSQDLLNTQLGIKLLECFQATHKLAEHEKIRYKVESVPRIHGFPCLQWTRKVPCSTNENPSSMFNLPPDSQATEGGSSLVFDEQDEPHIMICLEAAAFVEAVQKDELASLFRQLTEKCPDKRLHLLVHRLDGHLQQRERKDYREFMRGTNGSIGFNRLQIDTFVQQLPVVRPGVMYRDVRTPDEGADYAKTVTMTIAKSVLKKNDAGHFLKAKGNKNSDNLKTLLTTHEIECYNTKTFMSALCTVPSIGPQIAHPLATRFKSLGALGTYLKEQSKSKSAKERELENMSRVGAARAMRVGPKAARQLVDVLMSSDPDVMVYDN